MEGQENALQRAWKYLCMFQGLGSWLYWFDKRQREKCPRRLGHHTAGLELYDPSYLWNYSPRYHFIIIADHWASLITVAVT